MSLLVRKIDKAKWLQNDIIADEEVSADAITICLRTSENKLSVWKVSTETDIKEAILAIVSGGDHLESIDIITIDSGRIASDGISIIQNPKESNTRVQDLKKTHYDIIDLTYRKLGFIANYIVGCFKKGQIINSCKEGQVLRCTEGYLKLIIQEAIQKQRLNIEDLPHSIKKKLPQPIP